MPENNFDRDSCLVLVLIALAILGLVKVQNEINMTREYSRQADAQEGIFKVLKLSLAREGERGL